MVTSIFSQFSLHGLHLLSLCFSLSHSFKFTPTVTSISIYHFHSTPDSSVVAPTLPHSTPIQSHSALNSPLLLTLGPIFSTLLILGHVNGPSSPLPLPHNTQLLTFLCPLLPSSFTLPNITSIHAHTLGHSLGLIHTGILVHP